MSGGNNARFPLSKDCVMFRWPLGLIVAFIAAFDDILTWATGAGERGTL